MTNNADRFKQRLISNTGLSESAISAAWPEWWSDAADSSPSAQAELRFSLARKLGLDPRSLVNEDGSPTFVWDDSAKYKNFKGDGEKEKPVITSFGTSLARILLKGCEQDISIVGKSATSLRTSILQSQSFVGIVELLSLLWGVGIPLVHLRIYPLSAKRMCAMTVQTNGKFAIFLARDSSYPAPLVFHIAHEIAHIALGHLENKIALVDMTDVVESSEKNDPEEVDADKFALELLTGSSEPSIVTVGESNSAKQLAKEVIRAGHERQIEPGTLALCYGHSTQKWALANKALRFIYDSPQEAWVPINTMAKDQLLWGNISDDVSSYIHAVLGGI